MEGPILLVFENLSKIFSEGILVIAINKAFVTLHLDHDYIIYDVVHICIKDLEFVEINIY